MNACFEKNICIAKTPEGGLFMHENIMREVDNSFIDHIICAGGATTVMRHDTIRANGCNILSDHSPIYADIDLK